MKDIFVNMQRHQSVITIEQLKASLDNPVDNTGNIREWPSEEILAYFAMDEFYSGD